MYCVALYCLCVHSIVVGFVLQSFVSCVLYSILVYYILLFLMFVLSWHSARLSRRWILSFGMTSFLGFVPSLGISHVLFMAFVRPLSLIGSESAAQLSRFLAGTLCKFIIIILPPPPPELHIIPEESDSKQVEINHWSDRLGRDLEVRKYGRKRLR